MRCAPVSVRIPLRCAGLSTPPPVGQVRFGGPPMFGPSCRSSVVDLPASRLSKGSTVAARTVLIGTVKSYSAVKGFGPQA